MRNVARVGCLAGVASLLLAAAWLWLEVPAPAAPAVHATALSLASTVALHVKYATAIARASGDAAGSTLGPGRSPSGGDGECVL